MNADFSLATYGARLDAYCRAAHTKHGCTSLCPPDCKFKPGVTEVSDTEPVSAVVDPAAEALEIAEFLSALTPADLSADVSLAVEALREAMDRTDELKAQQNKAKAPLQAALDAACAPFKEPLLAQAAVIAEAKAALIRLGVADDEAQLAAIAARAAVPAPRVWPKGVIWKRETVLQNVDIAQLPERFTCRVADTDAILAATEAGEEVPGARTATEIAVQLRRS